ncbi:TetR/AcrR family transcriptional regulator [Aliiroseovarius sp. KMU-50]|uniref:TetR/AcrR family transcriptional regulator n=1 Tax=Aliiroseovarius salicola TaxID=3009082 RepID=A0ABT4VYA3_9RHOB|nr:TetR/AcrR family transcriptional regulator [Aliiroseovarius sp. KMU-50]MDA5093234.1 TetR/AcrR family transcriptional regulator [Aliiroseovarius sp. KMU-50]
MEATTQKPHRGRPKTLDRDHVLQVAMESYWSEGPTAISINEICRRAGVSKPGLYREFGSEDGLRRTALEAYRDAILAQLFEILSADIPFNDALDALIELALEDRAKLGIPAGCLLGQMRQCRNELGPQTNEAIELMCKSSLARIEDWIDRAKKNGQFPVEIPTATAALYADAQIASAIRMQAEGVAKNEISKCLQWAFRGLGLAHP